MKLLADKDERFKGLFIKVSVLILLAVAGLFLNLMVSVIKKGFFTPKTAIYFVADSGQDIKSGMPVKLSGFKIGAVSKIDLDDRAQAVVEILIDDRYFHLLHEDSSVSLKKEGVIGDSILEARRGGEEMPVLLPKAKIQFQRSGGLDQIAVDLRERLYPALDEVNKLLKTLNDPKGDVRQTLSNVRQFTDELQATHARINHILSEVDQGVTSDIRPALRSVKKSLENAEAISVKLNEDIPSIMKKTEASIENVRKTTETIKTTVDNSAPHLSGLMGETRGLVSDTRNVMDSASTSWPLKNFMQPPEQGLIKMDSHD